MPSVQFIMQVRLPKRFTRKQFNIVVRECSYTSHPEHHLQRLVEKGVIKHLGKGTYQQ